MAGLFDTWSNDPNAQAQMAMIAGLLSGRGSFNGILGQALASGQGQYNKASELQNEQQLRNLQTQEAQQNLELRRQQMADQEAVRRFWGSSQNYTNPAVSVPQTGPSPDMSPMPNLQFPPTIMSPQQVAQRMVASGSPALAQQGFQGLQKSMTPTTLKPSETIGTFDQSTGAYSPSFTAPAAPKETGPSPLAELILERSKLPPGHPMVKVYDAAIEKAATHQPPTAQVNVSNFEPASNAAQRDFIAAASKRYDQYSEAPATLQNIERAKALVKQSGGFVGAGGEMKLEAAKFLNANLGLGIDPTGIKSAEELRSRLFFQILDNLKKMDASPSQQQQEVMRQSLGNLGTDPNAIPNILDAFGDAIRTKVSIHNKSVRDAQGRGVKFPFDPTIDLGPLANPTGSSGWSIRPR